MLSKLIDELENYLGPTAGFVVKDSIERLGFSKNLDNTDKKILVDVICDEVLNLSLAKTKFLKSKFYSIMGVKSYSNQMEFWR